MLQPPRMSHAETRLWTAASILPGTEIVKTLRLERCYLEEEPDLTDARTRFIWITDSHLPGLNALHVKIDGQLNLERTVVAYPLGLVMMGSWRMVRCGFREHVSTDSCRGRCNNPLRRNSAGSSPSFCRGTAADAGQTGRRNS